MVEQRAAVAARGSAGSSLQGDRGTSGKTRWQVLAAGFFPAVETRRIGSVRAKRRAQRLWSPTARTWTLRELLALVELGHGQGGAGDDRGNGKGLDQPGLQ